MKLTIRKNNKYYQLGYYESCKWINVKQLGTPEKVYKMVCEFERQKELISQLSGHTKNLLLKKTEKQGNHTNND